MLASAMGYQAIAEALLASGADVNARSADGQTALMAASDRGYTKIVSLLLEAGADPNLETPSGYTALRGAIKNGHEDCRSLLATRMNQIALATNECSILPFRIEEDSVARIRDLFLGNAQAPVPSTLKLDAATVVPDNVTYLPLTAAQNKAAAADFLSRCAAGASALAALQGTSPILLGPRLTTLLVRSGLLAKLDHATMIMNIPLPRAAILVSCGIRGDSISSALHLIRNLVYSDGPVTVRKLNQQELSWYWAIISWDIDEPTLVFENESHALLIDFDKNGVLFFVDLLENPTWGTPN
jgi:hypothetical protein